MKINIATHLTISLAYLLCGSVLLSSAHAKDLVKHGSHDQSAAVATKAGPTDLNAKVIGELHNHTEKTALKTFAKAVSTPGIVARERELKRDVVEIEKNLSHQVFDTILFWRMALTLRV